MPKRYQRAVSPLNVCSHGHRLNDMQTMPVVGFLNTASPKAYARELAGFLKGLGETGYVEGSNFKIEYRWADDQPGRARYRGRAAQTRPYAAFIRSSLQAVD